MSDRVVRDELLTSERYWGVSPEARNLFISVVLSVDDAARMSASSFVLRTKCMAGTVSPERIEKLLLEIVDVDLVRVYEVDGSRYLFVPRFRQRKRYVSASKHPAPPTTINDLAEKKTDSSTTQVRPKSDPSQTQDERRGVEEGLKRGRSRRRESGARLLRGTRLPQNWIPGPEGTTFCEEERPDLNPSEVLERFRDYWLAQPGQKGVKADWMATWRNWVRREGVKHG